MASVVWMQRERQTLLRYVFADVFRAGTKLSQIVFVLKV